jgi:hypothetical protein
VLVEEADAEQANRERAARRALSVQHEQAAAYFRFADVPPYARKIKGYACPTRN